MNNYDLIQSKSIEEMAEFLGENMCPPKQRVNDKVCLEFRDNCKRCWKKWLKREVKA